MKGVPTPPNQRSVKIPSDERGGWSSDRPRKEGAPERPAEGDALAARVLDSRGAALSLGKVRALLAERVGDEEAASRAGELLDAAVAKRLQSGEPVLLATESLDPAVHERYVRMAHPLRRPRHLILLEPGRDQVDEEDRGALNDLRRRLDAGELGAEGFETALRLGGNSVGELKRILFRPAQRDD
jgi:hypothetical protein